MENNISRIEYHQEINTLRDAINFLKPLNYDTSQKNYEFEIDPKINPTSPNDIKDLTAFPYEFSLMEYFGKILVNTGSEHSLETNEGYRRRMRIARMDLHTHPIKNKEIQIDTPSISDLQTAAYFPRQTPLIIASPRGGFIIYHIPEYDPISNMSLTGDPRDIILKYGISHGIDIFHTEKPEKNLRYISEMSNKEIYKFERDFAEETKAIEQEISWEDINGIQKIMDIINLKSIK